MWIHLLCFYTGLLIKTCKSRTIGEKSELVVDFSPLNWEKLQKQKLIKCKPHFKSICDGKNQCHLNLIQSELYLNIFK